MDINNHGQIVGSLLGEDSEWRPLVWSSPPSLPLELPLQGNSGGMAWSINDDGIIVGGVWNRDTELYSLMAWKIAASGTDVIVLDAQEIVSSSEDIDGVSTANNGYVTYAAGGVAFRLVLAWDGLQVSEVVDSRTQLFGSYAIPNRVNDQGTVCGEYMTATGRLGAFAMTVAGDLLDLPTLPGGKERGKTYVVESRRARAINNNNQLVGLASKFFPSTGETTDRYDVILNVGVRAGGWEKRSGGICAKHPKGRSGK